MQKTSPPSIEAVENGFRHAVVIRGEKPQHMNLFDRMKVFLENGFLIAPNI